MSRTTGALLVKFLMTLIAGYLTFRLINHDSWGWLLMTALVATVVNYLIGDLVILKNFGNVVASISDGVLGVLVAYMADKVTAGVQTNSRSLWTFAVIIAVAEYFFHQYLLSDSKVAPNEE